MPKSHSPRTRAANKRRAIVLTTPEGKIQFADTTARRWLKDFFGPAASGTLPAKICRWLRTHQQYGPPILVAAGQDNAQLLVAKHKFSTEQSMLLLLELSREKGDERSRRHRALTPRERDVFGWVTCGKSNPEIAAILGRKTATVKKHLERIYAKLGVENRASAISSDFHISAVKSNVGAT